MFFVHLYTHTHARIYNHMYIYIFIYLYIYIFIYLSLTLQCIQMCAAFSYPSLGANIGLGLPTQALRGHIPNKGAPTDSNTFPFPSRSSWVLGLARWFTQAYQHPTHDSELHEQPMGFSCNSFHFTHFVFIQITVPCSAWGVRDIHFPASLLICLSSLDQYG